MSGENPSQVLEATESFVCDIDGERYTVIKGETRLVASHTLAKHHPRHFRPVEDSLSYPAEGETATASPGERRARPTSTISKEK